MTCPVVGLVGGVGSGKSTLTRRAADLFGLAAIDGDAAGHRALDDHDVKIQIRRHFGDAVFTSEATVDRSVLAQKVFGSSNSHASDKAALEQITHPFIRSEFREQIALAKAAGAAAILLDAAVLFEAGWREFCDVVIFVDAPEHLRWSRIADRGWSETAWRRREASQLPLEEKRRLADAAIDNSGTLDNAAEALAGTIERLCGVRFARPAGVQSQPSST